MSWEELVKIFNGPDFVPFEPHVREKQTGRAGMITWVDSRQRCEVRWLGGMGGEDECKTYNLKNGHPDLLDIKKPWARFRVRVLDDRSWITCSPLNTDAWALIHNKRFRYLRRTKGYIERYNEEQYFKN